MQVRRITSFLITLLSLELTAGMARAADTKADGRYGPLFQAMDRSPQRSIELEARGGEITGFATRRSLPELPNLRLDLIPVPQGSVFKSKPPSPIAPLQGTAAGLLEACFARTDFGFLSVKTVGEGQEARIFYRIGFDQPNATVIEAGQFKLELTPKVLRYLSVNRVVEPSAATARRLAVIIHEPHSSRAGQFQMVAALRQLLPDPLPKPKSVLFLVEGSYWNNDRSIPLTPWDRAIGTGPDAEPVVREFLYNYVIEGALATRLLRQADDIASFAIDDNPLLVNSPRQPDTAQLRDRIAKLRLSKEDRDALKLLLDGLSLGTKLNAEQYRELVAGLDEMRAQVGGEIRTVLDDLKALAQVYQLADQRDGTMVQQIGQRMREYPDALPFIFIGNFHTEGMLKQLQMAQPATRFVVLDVRGTLEDGKEGKEFDDALHGHNPWLEKWSSLLRRKLHVTPNPKDRPAIERSTEAIRRARATEPALPDELASLKKVGVRLPGRGTPPPPPPPPPYKRAFAFFEPDGGDNAGPRGTLFWVGAEQGRRQSKSRIDVIGAMISEAPWLAHRDGDGLKVERWIDGREFFTAWDGKRLYFFELTTPKDLLMLIEEQKANPEEADLRLQRIVEIESLDVRRRAA